MNKVFLIHGIFDTPAIFRPMRRYLGQHGWIALAPQLSPSSGRPGLDKLAEQLRAFVGNQIGPDEQFDLVGYSMGGLIGRYYLQRLGGLARVRRFITLACPHNGSYTAHLLPSRGGQQMRPGSDFLQDLNRDAAMLEQVGFVSLWTPFDLSVVPARSAVLPVGRNFQVKVAAHPLMALSRRSMRQIVRFLEEPDDAGQ